MRATRSPTPRASARPCATSGWSAGSRTRPPDSIVWRDSVDLTRDPRSRIQALLNMAAILRCGLPQPALRVPADRVARGPGVQRRGRRPPSAGARRAAASSATCSTTGLAGCSARCAIGCCARPGASRSTSARRCATCTCPAPSTPRSRPARGGGRARLRRHPGRAAAARRARARLLRSGGQPRAHGAGAASLPRRVLPPPALGLRARGGVYGLVVDSVNVSVFAVGARAQRVVGVDPTAGSDRTASLDTGAASAAYRCRSSAAKRRPPPAAAARARRRR